MAGSASFPTDSLPPGSNTITATYGADQDPIFAGSTGAITQTVKFHSTVVITMSTPNPSNPDQSVTFTVKVTSKGGAMPTGNIEISEPLNNGTNPVYGRTVLTLSDGGVGTVTNTEKNFSAGTHELTATYGGDTTHTAATSPDFEQKVGN